MDEIEKLAAFGSVVPPWRIAIDTQAGATSGLALAAIAFDMIERIGREFEEADRVLASDPFLSEQGKERRRVSMREEVGARLDIARGHIARLFDEARQVRADATSPTDTPDTVKAAIWGWLETYDPMQIELAHREAVNTRDWPTADAIECMPSVHPAYIGKTSAEELRDQRVRAANPAAARRVVALETAIADLEARIAALQPRDVVSGAGFENDANVSDNRTAESGAEA